VQCARRIIVERHRTFGAFRYCIHPVLDYVRRRPGSEDTAHGQFDRLDGAPLDIAGAVGLLDGRAFTADAAAPGEQRKDTNPASDGRERLFLLDHNKLLLHSPSGDSILCLMRPMANGSVPLESAHPLIVRGVARSDQLSHCQCNDCSNFEPIILTMIVK
jgi:hypothetical protein